MAARNDKLRSELKVGIARAIRRKKPRARVVWKDIRRVDLNGGIDFSAFQILHIRGIGDVVIVPCRRADEVLGDRCRTKASMTLSEGKVSRRLLSRVLDMDNRIVLLNRTVEVGVVMTLEHLAGRVGVNSARR